MMQSVYTHLENHRLLPAILQLQKEAVSLQSVEAQTKLAEVLHLYKQLANYTAAGKIDEHQDEVLNYLEKKLWEVADQLQNQQAMKNSGAYYYQACHLTLHLNSLSVVEVLELLLPQEQIKIQDRSRYDQLLAQLFEQLWCMPSWTPEVETLLTHSPLDVKLQAAAAAALALHYRWDYGLITFVLHELALPDIPAEYRIRLGWVLLMATHKHQHRLKLFQKELKPLLEEANKGYSLARLLHTLLMRYALALYANTVTEQMNEEFSPLAQKMTSKYPDLSRKMGLVTSGDPTAEDLEELIAQSSLDPDVKKFEEQMNKLAKWEEDGLDVAFFSFSHLKSFPFFDKLAHWFLPFDVQHSAVAEVAKSLEHWHELLPVFKQKLCDSDLYSLLLASNNLPFWQEPMAQTAIEELKHISANELGVETKGYELQLQFAAKNYMEVLYRFYQLHPLAKQFEGNPFDDNSFTAHLTPLRDYLSQEGFLKALAISFAKHNRNKQAINTLELLLTAGTEDYEIYLLLGHSYYHTGQWTQAIRVLQIAELIAPRGDRAALMLLAKTYRANAETQKAQEIYKQVLEQFPEEYNALIGLALLYIEQKKYPDALQLLYQYEFTAPTPHKVYRYIAWTAFLNKEFDKAHNYYTMLIEQGVKTATDYLNRGHLFLAEGDIAKAVSDYQQSIELSSADEWEQKMGNDEKTLEELGISQAQLALITDITLLQQMPH